MRKPTLHTVAEIAGVSFSTVSRILSEDPGLSVMPETRERVWQAAQETGYLEKRARAKRTHKSRTMRIGLVIAPKVDLKSITYYAMLLESVQSALTDAGQQIAYVLYHKDVVDKSLLRNSVSADNIDGLIICGRSPEFLLKLADAENIPATIISSNSFVEDWHDRVAIDHVRSAAKAVRHLAALGATNIAYVGPVQDTPRYQGYLAGMAQAGLRVRTDYICECNWMADSAMLAMQAAIERWGSQLPDGLFAAADELAIGVLRALFNAGLRAPDDVRVVGHDDQPFTGIMAPSLTTIRAPLAEMGQAAVRQLMERISGVRQYPQHIFLPTKLVIRESCGGLRQSSQEGGVRQAVL